MPCFYIPFIALCASFYLREKINHSIKKSQNKGKVKSRYAVSRYAVTPSPVAPLRDFARLIDGSSNPVMHENSRPVNVRIVDSNLAPQKNSSGAHNVISLFIHVLFFEFVRRKEFNSHRIPLVHQHVLRFIVLEVKMPSSCYLKAKRFKVVFVNKIIVLV